MAPLDPAALREAQSSRDRMVEAQHELERARADYNHAIRRLHLDGGSLREIAESLGLSHQRVHQVVEAADEPPHREPSRRRFAWQPGRFTRRARRVVVLAQQEADALGHRRVGTEHLLLGLVQAQDEATAGPLAEAGVSASAVRDRVAALEQPGSARRRTFTRAAKRALERSLRETRTLGDNFIGAEHVLLGLLADPRAGAVAILRELGADPDALTAAVAARASDRRGSAPRRAGGPPG